MKHTPEIIKEIKNRIKYFNRFQEGDNDPDSIINQLQDLLNWIEEKK